MEMKVRKGNRRECGTKKGERKHQHKISYKIYLRREDVTKQETINNWKKKSRRRIIIIMKMMKKKKTTKREERVQMFF
jgi:hypothetical protein